MLKRYIEEVEQGKGRGGVLYWKMNWKEKKEAGEEGGGEAEAEAEEEEEEEEEEREKYQGGGG